jgi:flagellar protein FlaG
LKSQPAVLVSINVANTKQSVDAKNTDDAIRKTETKKTEARIESVDPSSSVAEAKDTINSDELKQAVSNLNDYVQNLQRDLQFSIDKESGVMVVKVIDTKSEKVIRQIPTEETLRLARTLAAKDNEGEFNIFSSRA